MLRALSMIWRKRSAVPPRFMRLRTLARGVLQRDVEVLGDVVVARDGFEQARGDLVGVGVEEAQPLEAGERGEGVEEVGESGALAGDGVLGQVFAVAGGVLADEGDFADALRDEDLASATMEAMGRERNLPRSCGMMQKLQGWSQPSAILM